MSKHYDYLAIGGGSGGIASINRAAMYGQKCALIEAKELGGTCVNVGCVPKKVMWHAAQIREAIHLYGPDYGFDTTINHFDWEKLVASRSAYIDRIHTSYENVLGKNNVDVIKGFARFVDAKTIEVNGETITADHILIATGGRPSHPDIPGVEYGIDSDGFFALPALPERVAVVGAGYIAVELAGVINGLGAKTHLFVRKHAPLRSFDPMISETLVEVMNAEGPQLHTNAIPKAVVKNADGSLTLELGNLSQKDGQAVNTLCRQLYSHTFFSRYQYQKQEKVVRLSLQPAPKVRQFFEGGWLEWYALIELLQHLQRYPSDMPPKERIIPPANIHRYNTFFCDPHIDLKEIAAAPPHRLRSPLFQKLPVPPRAKDPDSNCPLSPQSTESLPFPVF